MFGWNKYPSTYPDNVRRRLAKRRLKRLIARTLGYGILATLSIGGLVLMSISFITGWASGTGDNLGLGEILAIIYGVLSVTALIILICEWWDA